MLSEVPLDAAILNEEPFGPVAIVNPFAGEEAMIAEANRLPYGLAAYAWTADTQRQRRVAREIESGMVGINTPMIGGADAPFGGVKWSGHGSEDGPEEGAGLPRHQGGSRRIGGMAHELRTGGDRGYLRIATEEAFATREQIDAYLRMVPRGHRRQGHPVAVGLLRDQHVRARDADHGTACSTWARAASPTWTRPASTRRSCR